MCSEYTLECVLYSLPPPPFSPFWCSDSSGSPDGSKAMYGLWSAVVASTRSLIREQQLTTAPYMALEPSSLEPHCASKWSAVVARTKRTTAVVLVLERV